MSTELASQLSKHKMRTKCTIKSDAQCNDSECTSDESFDKSVRQKRAGKVTRKSPNKYNRHWRKEIIADSYDAEGELLVCKYCDKRLKDPGNFIRHIRCHENPDLFNKCQFCDYKTVGRHTLREHLASRHQVDPDGNRLERNIKCKQCSFTCVSNFQLRNHSYLRHAEKGLKCHICGYSSHSKSVIAIHTKAVHGNNERPFMCETCGYCAKTLGVFRNHLKVHGGRRVCDVCGLALTQHSFNGHMKLHSNDVRPHVCHLCVFAARKRYCLKVHLKNVHKIDIDFIDLGGKSVDNEHSYLTTNNFS